MESVSILWPQIQTWLKTHAPDLWKVRQPLHSPGASEEVLQQAEAELGVTLPDDFKAFYRLHNGQGAEFLLVEITIQVFLFSAFTISLACGKLWKKRSQAAALFEKEE